MRFDAPLPVSQRRGHAAFVPMISLALVLAIAIPIAAGLGAPAPHGPVPAAVFGQGADSAPNVLLLGADGVPVFGGQRGPEALAALGHRSGDRVLIIQAAPGTPLPDLAGLLPHLRAAGIGHTQVVTVR